MEGTSANAVGVDASTNIKANQNARPDAEPHPNAKHNAEAKAKAAAAAKFPSTEVTGFSEAEFEVAIKVLERLRDRPEVYKSRAMKRLRSVVFDFVQQAKVEYFQGTDEATYKRSKSHKKQRKRVKDQVMKFDRQLIESRRLRQARINQLNALMEPAPGSVPLPLIPDGAVDDGTGINSSVGQAGGTSSVPRIVTIENVNNDGGVTVNEEVRLLAEAAHRSDLEDDDKGGDIGNGERDGCGGEYDDRDCQVAGADGTKRQRMGDNKSKDALWNNNSTSDGNKEVSSSGDATMEVAQPVRLLRPRSCYVCKARFFELHHFYDQLCPSCAALNWKKRLQVCDLHGRTALLTGGRVKIGYHIALKLLRCGAKLIVTTRFPADAALRFSREHDYIEWRDRLSVYGIDLRDIAAVEAMAAHLNRTLDRLDIIVNNACQTIRRPAAYYRHLLENEAKVAASKDAEVCANLDVDGPSSSRSPFDVVMPQGHHGLVVLGGGGGSAGAPTIANVSSTGVESNVADGCDQVVNGTDSGAATVSVNTAVRHVPSALLSQLPLTAEDQDNDPALFPVGTYDVNAQQVDLRTKNSWLLTLSEVSTTEAVEVMAVNALAPMIINARLKQLMERSGLVDEPRSSGKNADSEDPTNRQEEAAGEGSGRLPDVGRYIVNVSAMEGKFYRHKSPCHPHTNMAKASLNMLVRTSAQDYFKSGIFMTAVDTGWINDENPLETAARTAKVNNFQTPIDEVDAAARVLDPVMSGVTESNPAKRFCGVFLKDYHVTEW